MEDFVMTRGARQKQNVEEDFVSITHERHKKKPKKEKSDLTGKKNDENSNIDPKRQQEIEMKRLRWDIMKFGTSGFDKKKQKSAKLDLLLSLGARPPKNGCMHIKKLQEIRKREKIRENKPVRDSGAAGSLKKIRKPKKKREKKDSGILGVYGTVSKTESS